MDNSTNAPLTFPHLNPNTSLAFLPPSVAAQLEATRYLSIASLAAFFWDLLCTSGQDYRLITQYTLNLPVLVYLLSRISSLAHIVSTTMFHVAPISDCKALPMVIGWCWVVAIPSTSMLFLFRIKAVFDGQRGIIALFFLLWLAVLAGSITVPFALAGGHIANTDRCIPTAVKPFSSAGIIASTCNDTLVFIAISWRIVKNSPLSGKVKSFFGGRNLPYLSRELLRGGQQYYLITVGGNIFVMAMLLSPATPPLLRDMFPVINMALENSMACRVFRNIKLGREQDRAKARIDNSLPTSNSQQPVLRKFSDSSTAQSRVVEIMTTVESFNDEETVVKTESYVPEAGHAV